MVKLYNSKPKRFFTFGCSFTKWYMNTWADIIAREIGCKLNNPKQAKCEYYNMGLAGAGNFYIANAITQADLKYNFGPEDLVIVMWTQLFREDRWTDKGWLVTGNVFNQRGYSDNFVKNYANIGHFAIRDFMCIRLIDSLLQKTQHHHLQMVDLANYHQHEYEHKLQEQVTMYKPWLDKMKRSFFDTMFNGNICNKLDTEHTIHPKYKDGHPHIKEHYEFLCKTFDYPFDQQPIEQCYESWYEHIHDVYKNVDQPTHYTELVVKGLTKDVDFYSTPFSLI